MKDLEEKKPIILISGDVTFDWNIAQNYKSGAPSILWSDALISKINFHPGGAFLLYELIRNSLDVDVQLCHPNYHQIKSKNLLMNIDDKNYHHVTYLWSQFQRSKESKENVWRIKEFQGINRRNPDLRMNGEFKKNISDSEEADMVIIDDSALGFRGDPASGNLDHRKFWPSIIKNNKAENPWIFLKTSWPIAQGDLTEHLLEHFAENLVVIIAVRDLRRSEFQISSGLSWEASAEDLVWEMTYNPKISKLKEAAFVVVSFGVAGAWVSNPSYNISDKEGQAIHHNSCLIFDHNLMESMWEQNYPGGMIGYTSCLTTALIKAFINSPRDPKIIEGIQSGLYAMKVLHETGFIAPEDNSSIRFPFEDIKVALNKKSYKYGLAKVPPPKRLFTVSGVKPKRLKDDDKWSILRNRYHDNSNLMKIGEQIVLHGAGEVLKDVPIGKFGNFVTADRNEIEGFRSICNLIQEYCLDLRPSRPLSIAVFGPPGSGKSFGVTQVAKSIRPNEIKKITFNLSQFENQEDLIHAFHQVRDIGLSGFIPLIFWDEFDTNFEDKRLGWLRHFLVPMQDGEFQHGQIIHPIGKAIFVFAGGTVSRLQDLGKNLDENENKSFEYWKTVKGPDFLSRLKGYINIIGADRQCKFINNYGTRFTTPDPLHIVRRAIVLRSILERNVPQIVHQKKDGIKEIDIDRGLLRAFLGVWEYKHGIRSMESIVAMSQLANKTSFQRSSLPSKEQLDLHVNGTEFLGLLVQQVQFEGELLEKLAEANHETYRNEELKNESPAPLAKLKYHQLSDKDKESNRVAVRGIPHKLASISYFYIPAPDPKNISIEKIPNDKVDILAEIEHDRWVVEKIDQGYVYGKKRNDHSDPKRHPDLVPWKKMDLKELVEHYPPSIVNKLGQGPLKNEIDRDMVKKIPEILARIGFTIIRVQ